MNQKAGAALSQQHVEIMAPVGSYESLSAAIQAGADAVYFGVGNLNMRSRSAANFTVEDLERIAGIAHQHGVRTYLTVNTIIYNDEIEEMHELVHAAKAAGITAIIASDMAVITYAHSIGVEVHISTQCNISNVEAVRFFAQWADVVVTSRELPLRQVAEITQFIRDNDIRGPKGELVQVEVFAHGALCMSVSGKCYLSLDEYNYSANRGACLQLCRREYLVKDVESDTELLVSGKYIMSPKDLCTIGFLDKIIRAGVRVLKIEGRGRSADYVKTVVECYKEAVQAVAEGARGAIGVGVSCVIIGVIIGSVNMTGLGVNFGNMILKVVGEGQLFLGGLMVMVMSIILGMGVPGVAAYVIVYAVAVPVLRGVGATEMAANMFCLIYACLSNITPPVAMSSYVASGIAGSDMTRTSLIAIKLGIAGLIVPFFFLDNPVLLYGSTDGVTAGTTVYAFLTACVGVLALASGLAGLPPGEEPGSLKALQLFCRGLLVTAGVLFVSPSLVTDAAAAGLIMMQALLERVFLRRAAPASRA